MGVAPPPPAPLDPSYKPTVFLAELPADAPIEDILKILDRDGGVILTNFTSTEDLATLKKDTLPYWEGPLSKGTQVANLIPPETTLVHGLVGKSKVATRICEHPTLDMLRRNILEYQFTQNREGVIDKHRIDPLLSLSLTLNIGHGAPRQHLHRDDYIFGVKHDKTFELNQSEQLGCLIAGVRTTRENGATMVVPGSHRWDDSRQPRLDEITFAEMAPGSALIFLASVFHGGGANAVPNFMRTVHGFFFIRGTLRQEENQFLAVPHKAVLEMSEKMLSLLGYRRPTTILGLVEGGDPAVALRDTFISVTT